MSLEALRNAVKSEKITIGAKEVLRKLCRGEVKKVFLANTCSPKVRDEMKRQAAVKKIEIVELAVPSTEVALICKKNYPIGILSF